MFKRAKVVMLPTNEKADKGNICFGYYGLQMLKHSDGKTIANKQHLYILSDDEIKEGDWFIQSNSVLRTCFDLEWKGFYKIIATTDNLKVTLSDYTKDSITYTKFDEILPKPSQSFINKYIDEYNKGNIIIDVLVEYDEMYLFPDGSYSRSAQNMLNVKAVDLLKISKDNTITIKKIKDSWNRDEVITFGLKCVNLGMDLENNPLPRLNEMSGKDYYYKWIDENL